MVIFLDDTALFLREYHNRMYSVLAYYLSHILVRIPVSMLMLLIFVTIVYFMAGLNPDPQASSFLVNFQHDNIPCYNNSQSMGHCYGNGSNVITSQGFNETDIHWDSFALIAMAIVYFVLVANLITIIESNGRPVCENYIAKQNYSSNMRVILEINETRRGNSSVSGNVAPGQLLAIMGPSGAGKTTLLNALTGRNMGKMSVTGDVLINGRPVNGRTLASISSYIQQNDLFYPLLTVREHLMINLNLAKCSETRIGGYLSFKGISGGEMKRLSIATEKLFYLFPITVCISDEPTSGLDSFMAESIVRLLKTMACEGRTIVCTIHQPSSQVFALFDHLLLMTDGRVAFMGTNDNARNFFATHGYICPLAYSPSDYYMNQLAITSQPETRINANGICDKFVETEYMTEIVDDINQTKMDSAKIGNISPITVDDCDGFNRPGLWLQLTTLIMRCYLLSIRNTADIVAQLNRSLAMGIFIGLIYHKQYPISSDVSNINGILYMLMESSMFFEMFVFMGIFLDNTALFLREYHNRMYSVLAYYLSQILIRLPVSMVVPAIPNNIPCYNNSQSMGHCYGNGSNVIISQGFNETDIHWDSFALIAMAIVYLVLGYFGMFK
ncbi:unnamed protein product [Medioppia subpectinata]|uniref:ABC transporter domain-containing protein n=1 Tax=Medioppia subpectinata TaxID=1979941 RepID=A0A7R9PZG1_9ACAR|nr:unnamed protein product [Medioppia subpectinata]CAG2106905.1 unnamed protein product [Medioppia subpectinata]